MEQNTAIAQSWCKTRRELAEQFAIAARQYSEAVILLAKYEGTFLQTDYVCLRAGVEQADQRLERSLFAFEEHLKRHGCQFKVKAATDLEDSVQVDRRRVVNIR
jgi:hypothetical protein